SGEGKTVECQGSPFAFGTNRGPWRSQFSSLLCHRLSLWPGASHLASLCLSYLICKMDRVKSFHLHPLYSLKQKVPLYCQSCAKGP
uniref:Uncharacterized protein n=1 Tax=Gopherus agassizii TaxID=38772 RepID=A0A452IBN8_9SAUR